ncbi:hypothetical protein OG689_44035 [Kitasatospora sp. NBC_00240]|uniref:hypothetical protein n=1 Tax=Kitasatospora sp. NBC_00240 TaxID=2903567 RepID=UPI00224F074C|nr:hypothetical protein [Kitasatospora sp. NBC_00240]MCX5216107.1 hypothetical protein [Kitasatospora sp. NBC_00240]
MTANQDEQEDLQRLVRTLDQVAQLAERTTTDWDGWEVADSSPLAADDAKTHPYRLSHSAHLALVVAVDHLQALASSIKGSSADNRQDVLIHTHAQFTLIRAALENAARAVWLLGPKSRDDRIKRVLALHLADLVNSQKLAEVLAISAETGPDPKHMANIESRRAQIRSLLAAAGLTPAGLPPDQLLQAQRRVLKFPGYEVMVADAGTHIGDAHVRLFWKACSSLAHGDLSGTLAVLDRETARSDGKVATVQFTGSVPALVLFTMAALRMTFSAFDLYTTRARKLAWEAPVRPVQDVPATFRA